MGNMYLNQSTIRLWYTKFSNLYLFIFEGRTQRYMLSKVRLSSQDLKLSWGRRYGIRREYRYCEVCNLRDIEDEIHFTLICTFYDDLSSKSIPTYYF